MKLTILDGMALNPGDLSWNAFSEFAEVTVYQETPQDKVIERIADSDAVLLNKININSEILSACKNLKYIGVLATGYNVIDIEAVKKAGITVCNIPAYSTMAVAQHVFALILNFSNLVSLHNQSVRDGDWLKSPIFCYWKKPLFELNGKTLGILGYGNIGKQVEKIALSFGMKVLITPHKSNGKENCVSLHELLSKSDILTLHAPLTKETEKIINSESLARMKNGAYLINTARGGLVDEKAVKEALDNGKLSGFAADVISEEPMKESNPLYKAENCVLTPHLAWAPLETRERCLNIGLENFKGWLNGKIQNSIY
ncbi:MAG: D-2-hydroxyacid dehydrogenase [Treponema sp.]|nr:D-2-hydroxyacid dehydrogenase [Treponema sp.]